MVGWTRRNTESRRRRKAWWDSLTPEEREAVTRHEAEFDRKSNWVFFVLLVGWALWFVLYEACK